MRKPLLVSALALAVAAVAGPTFASSDNHSNAAPKANWMSIEQVTAKLTAEGYQVRQIKTEGNGYEVYAIDKEGKRLEGYVDPVTGNVTGSENGEED